MKLFYCSARWRFKGMRKRRGVYGYVIAENQDAAREKFKNRIVIPSEAIEIDFFTFEEKEGISISHYK